MVARVKPGIIFFCATILALALLLGNYFHYNNAIIKKAHVTFHDLKLEVRDALYKQKYPDDYITIKVADGEIHRKPLKQSQWTHIYDTYPLSSNGKDLIYDFLDDGDMASADLLLNNIYPIKRYKDVKITPQITWEEDPYNDRYWRFLFYGLRPTSHLLVAGRETGDQKYYDKLIQIVDGFLETGTHKTHAWDDYHAVAFRTMMLTHIWWDLRKHDRLTVDTSNKILESLAEHGSFLADWHHYELHFNHGINEAAALYVLAANFPDLPGANNWLTLARSRLATGLDDLVDDDGVLIENSPYYHFYILEKYWEIYKYSQKTGTVVSRSFDNKIKNMINYGTYILQPDLQKTLIGSSIKGVAHCTGAFKEMAEVDPYFRYVLTQGKSGTVPPKLNISYIAAGQSILRSGWDKGTEFRNQTQVIFDIGPYRTNHSHLDALSISLYGEGKALLPDSGLYSYSEEPFKSYFRGTSAHNTVTVDDKDQADGAAKPGLFEEGDGFAYQSAQHSLYDGVEHERAVALLGKRLVLIIDNLKSDKEHKYRQMFHLFPEAKLTKNGSTATFLDKNDKTALTIHQIIDGDVSLNAVKGQKSPIAGFYSEYYQKKIPNYEVSYTKDATTTSYITLLEIGTHDDQLKATLSSDECCQRVVLINSREADYKIELGETKGKKHEIKVKTPVVSVNNDADIDWSIKPAASDKPLVANSTEFALNPQGWRQTAAKGKILCDESATCEGKPSLTLIPPESGSEMDIEKKVKLDLSHSNIFFRMRVRDIENVDALRMEFSTKNWRGYVTSNLANAYRPEYDSEWIDVGLGKGLLRNNGGQWRYRGKGFDWSNIDRIRFTISAKSGQTYKLDLNTIKTTPEQTQGNVIFVFDDGHKSVWEAAELMKEYGLKGNVAVISERPDLRKTSYLQLSQIKSLQNDFGWDVVNHSAHHKNALEFYYENNNLSGLEKDVTEGLKYLESNGINSAPNWYVYPNGANNKEIRDIVGKYYMFARATRNEPEVYPFADPLNVKSFSVEDSTKPEQVIRAAKDAKDFNLTLMLTFHRISPEGSSPKHSYYNLDNLRKVVKGITDIKIPVYTLSELDKINNVPQNRFEIKNEIPEQVQMSIYPKKKRLPIDNIKTAALSASMSVLMISGILRSYRKRRPG
jgi:hypothetical protein